MQLFLVRSLLRADKGGVLWPRGERHPGVVQHLHAYRHKEKNGIIINGKVLALGIYFIMIHFSIFYYYLHLKTRDAQTDSAWSAVTISLIYPILCRSNLHVSCGRQWFTPCVQQHRQWLIIATDTNILWCYIRRRGHDGCFKQWTHLVGACVILCHVRFYHFNKLHH